jgi:DNA-directed RNA polymerase specialized sigma24 family protein
MSSNWADCRTVDPTELEARYSVADSMDFLQNVLDDEREDASASLERVREIMDDLPDREADFVDLYFFFHKTQTDIADIFKVSQPTVCYRLQRATERIRFLLSLPDVTIEEMEVAMRGFLADPEDVNIMVKMYRTTCQSEVASQLGITQGKVRHRFMRSTKRMGENEKMSKYAEIFTAISTKLNIRREVQRPAWESKIARIVD